MRNSKAIEELKSKVPQFVHRVFPVYYLLNWQWLSLDGKTMKIPTADEIEKNILSSIDSFEKSPDLDYVLCGGLMIFVEHEISEDGAKFEAYYGLRMCIDSEMCFI